MDFVALKNKVRSASIHFLSISWGEDFVALKK